MKDPWGEVGLQADGQYNFQASASFQEHILGYDAHGNIEGLQRTGSGGKEDLVANFGHYQYQAGTNQLTAIKTSVEAPINLRSYAYNQIGQLLHEQKGQAHQYLSYDAYGRVIGVYGDAQKTRPVARYGYNDQGQRMLKKSYNEQGEATKDTWYVRDASGTVMSIYEEEIKTGEPLVQVELLVYGGSRLGMLSTRGSDMRYQYELTDHLGNVRAVISRDRKEDGSVDVLHYQDYYAFGSVIQDNQRKLGQYRYGYQGQYSEQDEETSWNSFTLRQYDGETGRWLSVDPYGQYHSPYVAMGNAPNMQVDPSGGWSGAFTSPLVRYGAFAAGGAVVGAVVEGVRGGNTKRGAAIGAGAGLLLATGLSIDFSKAALPAVNRATITTAASIMNSAAREVTAANRVPTNVVLPGSELADLPPRRNRGLTNPSGGVIRQQDGFGDGNFGARRDGGTRDHAGIDITTVVGQNIVSPIDGSAVNFIGATSGIPMLEITPNDPNLGIDRIRILYVDMPQGTAEWTPYNVNAGDNIGNAANLVDLGYPPGITPHIHVEVFSGGQRVDPTPFFFPEP